MGRPFASPWAFQWVVVGGILTFGVLSHDGVRADVNRWLRELDLASTDLRHLLLWVSRLDMGPRDGLEQFGLGHCSRGAQVTIEYEDVAHLPPPDWEPGHFMED